MDVPSYRDTNREHAYCQEKRSIVGLEQQEMLRKEMALYEKLHYNEVH